jgi:peptidoglycan lytic transglycosylase
MWRGVVGCALVAAVLSGCGVFFGRRPPPIVESQPGTTEVGTASWYGPGFQGRQTSSGEIYDQFDLTAAHPTLPLGTRVAVTNLQNGRSIEVRINDRGPFVKGRAIDLSYAAARALGMIGPGTVPVRIEVLGHEHLQLAAAAYSIQVGAFADRGNALRLRGALARRFDGVYIATLDAPAGRYYRVRLGRFADRQQAQRFARAVVPLGLPVIIVHDGSPR